MNNYYDEKILFETKDLIISTYLIDEEKAEELAKNAIEGLISHGGNSYDFNQIRRVIEVVVKGWLND